ncbi:UvrD-helicase domain-containing protein [Serratia sp. DD3]|uniref:UvrD-helicase domain-containing protein n=1 Tax=Serratia sp. DD3 TaxID=1410619 RepID=UPI0003C519AF|nr:UvrD-helicase domain-containing protein [Serratia sp. DD3]KEY58796.1 ATP-dependent DNA helicase UvrD2 [Serratia sp. DD3]
MKIYLYHNLNPNQIPGYDKFVQAITADNFTQADVRKIDTNLYRARLNIRDRLLFSFYRYNHETVCLVLEYLPNHAYHTSRFIRQQVVIDEERLQPVLNPDEVQPEPMAYINVTPGRFYRLDKMLSFDDDQQALFEHPLPLVIVGSAGSGKTALVLEKMKQATGEILYLSLSSFLVEKARTLYRASGEENELQQVDFLSLREFLEMLSVPEGKEVTFNAFNSWLPRNKVTASLGSAHTLFEEFRGVIGASVSEQGPLSREAYLALGIKQSLYPVEARGEVYVLFERYVAWLKQSRQYDTNLLSHQYLSRATPSYDFIFIDEIQDMTPIQLFLILKTLRTANQFLLCGDANQVVHPNFFSWSKLKSLFFQHHQGSDAGIRILQANYRNAPHVTNLANRLLQLKQTRFGAIDRESHYVVKSGGQTEGFVSLLEDKNSVKKELNEKTARSANVAVVVMHPEQKELARRWFKTPLVFSVQEAKGLEYETVILFNLVSEASKVFDDICQGVSVEDLEGEARRYARPRDKQDRSAEIYKFFINALYVAITRATHNVYLVEQRIPHPLWSLLALSHRTKVEELREESSSLDEWQEAARQLERQGKQEQADAIREQITQQQGVSWQVIDPVMVGLGQWPQPIIAESSNKASTLQAVNSDLTLA